MGSQSGSDPQRSQPPARVQTPARAVRLSTLPVPSAAKQTAPTPSNGVASNLVPAAPYHSSTDVAPARSATPARTLMSGSPDFERGVTTPVWTAVGLSGPVRISTPAPPSVPRSSPSPGPVQPAAGAFRQANPEYPVIPAVYPDAVAPSASVRTIMGTVSGLPTGEVASARKGTPEMGVMLQRPAPFAKYAQPTASVVSPSEGAETSPNPSFTTDSRRTAMLDTNAPAQKPGSALLVRLAAPVAPLPARLAVKTELLPRGAGEVPSDVLPAQIKSSRFDQTGKAAPHLPLLQKEGDTRAAAFRALRRRLAEQNNPAVILVTSAEDGEGKSTCAANLALSMAESGRLKVLLVEANVRQPKLAEIFGFRPSPCFLEQLAAHRKEMDAPWFTTEIQPVGLHVLAVSPKADRNRSIHGPSFLAAVARWRLAFDHVVVDGPAILSSCEAAIIQDSVDRVLMVARSGVSRNRTIKRALDQVASDMVAGLVLMDSRWAH